MNKLLAIIILTFAVTAASTTSASASWMKKNWRQKNGYDGDWNPYQVWCPRYWIKEMANAFDDDDYPYPRGYGPYGEWYPHSPGYYPYTSYSVYYPYGRGYYSK